MGHCIIKLYSLLLSSKVELAEKNNNKAASVLPTISSHASNQSTSLHDVSVEKKHQDHP